MSHIGVFLCSQKTLVEKKEGGFGALGVWCVSESLENTSYRDWGEVLQFLPIFSIFL